MIPGYLSPLVNHLWQSTLFAVIAGLVTLLLRKNRAAVRYRLWLAASVKFLVPFSWLVAIGSRVQWRTAPAAVSAGFSVAMEQVFAPQAFAAATRVPVAAPASAVVSLPALLFATWALGVLTVCVCWWRQWLPIRRALKHARPIALDAASLTSEVAVMSSPYPLEPGIVGIRRPVLLLPEGIADRLQPSQLDAIVVHELCHVRRRDNLAAVVHMVVEALYWFHPIVWWIEARLVDERERACDEEVLRMGSAPAVYAEGILKVCRFYAESPVVFASGVTGSDLNKRIEAIMRNRAGDALGVWKRLFLVTTAVVAVAAPMLVGVLNPPLRAQSQPAVFSSPVPEFEVASIKSNKSGSNRVNLDLQPGGRFIAVNVSLEGLVRAAYGDNGTQLPGNRVLISATWMEGRSVTSEHYDIEAKAAGDITRIQLQPALQRLLADRFKLVVHHETRDLPGYDLVMANADRRLGPRLRQSDVDCSNPQSTPPTTADGKPSCGFQSFPGKAFGRVTMSDFTRRVLPNALEGRPPVVDRTSLAGTFQFDLDWTPDGPASSRPPDAPPAPPIDPKGPSLFTALREQLGLRLDARKEQIDILVIDHAQPPTDNQTDPAAPSSPQPRSQSSQVFGLSSGGGSGVGTQLDVANFCCPDYVTAMMERIKANWNEPQDAAGQAVVRFTIQRDGVLREVAVEQSSGSDVFDRAARRAVVVARSLATLPRQFANPTLTVHLAFRSSQRVGESRITRPVQAASTSQSQSSNALPVFDVVSIKRNTSGRLGSSIRGMQPGGRYDATNWTAGMLIRAAYRLQDFQLSGGPGWLNADRFDIVAKADRAYTGSPAASDAPAVVG